MGLINIFRLYTLWEPSLNLSNIKNKIIANAENRTRGCSVSSAKATSVLCHTHLFSNVSFRRQVVEVLSKHAGLWITTNNDVFYSQATHITFICPMRFDAFPLDTQVTILIIKTVRRFPKVPNHQNAAMMLFPTLGSSRCTVVELAPRCQEIMGSNPAGCRGFSLLFPSS